MADDVNKSGKPVNGKSIPKPIEEAMTDRNRRIDHSYLDNDDKYSSMVNGHDLVQQEISNLSKRLKGTADPSAQAKIREQIQQSALLQQKYEEDIDRYQSLNANQQNNSLGDRIRTYTNSRNINQRTTTMAGEQRFLRMARENPDLYAPTEIIEQRIAEKSKELGNVGRELSTRIRGIGEEDIPSGMIDKAARINELQEDIALNKRMLRVQSKEGLSSEKRMYAAQDTLDNVGSYLKNDAIKKDVAAGKYGDIETETNKLAQMFEKLREAADKWEQASENAVDAQGNLTEEYKQASASLEKIQKEADQQRKIVTEVQRQGGGGGGWNGGQIRQAAGAFQSMVNAGYGMDINDKILEMQLKAETGRTAVAQFGRVNAGISGDMASLLRESTSQEFIKDFSDDMRSKAKRQAFFGTVATGVDAVGQGIEGMKGGRLGAGLGVGAGVMNTIRTGSQMFRGLPQTIKAMEAYRAGEEFSEVGLAVQAQGLQAVYDQQMSAFRGTSGLGSGAAAAEATLLDNHSLANFAKAGLTPGQAASLTSMSAGAVGGAQSSTSLALRAGQIGQTRLMSAEQFVGMTGQLADAGGGSSDLEEIMRNAVASGMDNAKNIQQMVSATVSLSGNLSKMGLSGAGAAGNLLSSTMQSIGGDKNIAALAAESMIAQRASMDSNSDMNIGNVIEHKMLRDFDSKLTTPELMSMAALTQTDLEYIKKHGRQGAYEFGLEKSFDRIGDVNKFVDKIGGIAGQSSAINLGIGVLGGTGEDLANIDSGDASNLTSDARAIVAARKQSYKMFNVKAGKNVQQGELAGSARGVGGDIQEAQARRSGQMLSYGGGDNINETLRQLATTMQALATHLSPEKAQERVTGAMDDMKGVGPVVKAGADFKDAAGVFTRGVERFNDILKKADLGEHKTSFNLQDNSRSNTTKRTG